LRKEVALLAVAIAAEAGLARAVVPQQKPDKTVMADGGKTPMCQAKDEMGRKTDKDSREESAERCADWACPTSKNSRYEIFKETLVKTELTPRR
jgi:hypothetical protein